MTGRQGGKLKPLKVIAQREPKEKTSWWLYQGPKKDNNKQLTEEDKVYQEKKKKELAELEEAKRRGELVSLQLEGYKRLKTSQ